MSSLISNISTSTLEERPLNPLLRGLAPYMAFDPVAGADMLAKGDMASLGVGFAGRFGNEVKLYLVEARTGRWKSARQVDELFELAIKWRPRQIFIEDNVGRDWLRENVNIHARGLSMHLPIIWVTASKHGTGKKKERIQALQSPFKYHQILFASHFRGSEEERQTLSWTPEGKGLDDFPDMLALMWLGINRKGMSSRRVREVGKAREPTYQSTGV